VLTKSVKTLTGILVALAAYGVSSLPAEAKPIQTKPEVLVSQLSGHDLYKPINSQLVLGDYGIGRVRGAVGSILFIELLKYPASASAAGYYTYRDRNNNEVRYTHLHLAGSAQPGDDVMIRRTANGGAWEVAPAHPTWISRLNLKEIPTFERTAVDFETTAPVALPPVQPSAPPVYTPAPAPAPVRGMW
jgi:hypothetical protein